MNARIRILVCTAFLVGGAEHAHAQGFAVRGGANVNPDQMYGGAQYEASLTDRVWFQPGADLGVGNGAKLFTEVRVVLNNPDLRFGVGYRFGARSARSAPPRTRPRR